MRKASKLLLSTALLATFAGGVVVPVVGTLVNTTDVYAAEPTPTIPSKTKFFIHKLQAESYNADLLPDGKENPDGKVIDNLNDLGSKVEPLDGVVFRWFKIDDNATKETLKGMSIDQLEEKYKTTGVLDETGKAGTAGQTDWEIDTPTDGTQARYWVVEESAPETVSSAVAVPFELTVPIAASDGSGYLSEANIYPKNVTSLIPTPDKDVEALNKNEASFNIGQTFTWILKGTIPKNMDKYEAYGFEDTLDDALQFVGVAKVVVAGQTLDPSLYKVTDDGQKYKVDLTKEGLAKVVELVPDPEKRAAVTPASIKTVTENSAETPFIEVHLQTKLKKNVTLGKDVFNNFVINYDNTPDGHDNSKPTPPSEKPKVYTGGKLFKKIAKEDQSTLAGAEFELLKEETVLTWTKELIDANDVSTNKDKFVLAEGKETVEVGAPIKLKSGKDGTFAIRGLSYDGANGTVYTLKETKAPANYVIPANPKIPFTVNATSYNKTETLTTAGTIDGDKADADKQNVENNKRPSIPQTGGIGSALFILAGFGSMIFAGLGLKKRKNQA